MPRFGIRPRLTWTRPRAGPVPRSRPKELRSGSEWRRRCRASSPGFWVKGRRHEPPGFVTLMTEEHNETKEDYSNSASRFISSDGNCLAPDLHRRRPKGSVRLCRIEMTLDIEIV